MENQDVKAIQDLNVRCIVLEKRLREQLLRDLFHRVPLAGETLDAINHYYCYHLLPRAYNLLILRAVPRKNRDSVALSRVLQQVEGYLRQELSPVFHELETTIIDERIVCLFNITSHRDSPATDQFKLMIGRFFSNISTSEKFADYDFIMGEGTPAESVAGLDQCFLSAVQAMEYGIVYGLNRRFDSYEQLQRLGDILSILTTRRKAQFRQAVESLNMERIGQLLDEIFSDSQESAQECPGLAYRLPHKMLDLTAETISDTISITEEFNQLLTAHQQEIDDCLSLESLRQITFSGISALCQYYEQHSTSSQSPAILNAKRYIQKNFRRKLSLMEIADNVQMNFQYLSVLFKQSTGVSITDYIAELRLDQAKYVLRTSNDSIQSIAESVGYVDAHYFSRVFHNKVGLTPSAYRAECRARN